jgi:hypothetical protein
MTLTDNTAFPVGVAYSMDENGTLIPETVSNTPSVPEPPKLEIIETLSRMAWRASTL